MLALFALRYELYDHGLLYGSDRIRAFDVLLVVAVALTVGSVVHYRRTAGKNVGDNITWGGGLLALVVAASAVVTYVVPDPASQTTLPPCDNISVLGAAFYAQTTGDSVFAPTAGTGSGTGGSSGAVASVPSGVNARLGPGVTYPQVDRFPGDCTLGFDGYCIGEPVENLLSGIVDTRWLLLHGRKREFVAAAKVLFQSPQSLIGKAPAATCFQGTQALGLPQPKPPSNFATSMARGKKDAWQLQAQAPGAQLVGYALRQLNPADGRLEYAQIGSDQLDPGPRANPDGTNDTFKGSWNPSDSAAALRHGSGSAELAAATCLAADTPVLPPTVLIATWRGGVLTGVKKGSPQNSEDAQRLGLMACNGPD